MTDLSSDFVTIAEGLDFLAGLAWAIFYGMAVGMAGAALFIIAMSHHDD